MPATSASSADRSQSAGKSFGHDGVEWHCLSSVARQAHSKGWTWEWGAAEDSISEASSLFRTRLSEKQTKAMLDNALSIQPQSDFTRAEIKRLKAQLKEPRKGITERKPLDDQLKVQRNCACTLENKIEKIDKQMATPVAKGN